MIHFYQQLGKLFYSIASADKEVQKEEIILQGNSYGTNFQDKKLVDAAFYKEDVLKRAEKTYKPGEGL